MELELSKRIAVQSMEGKEKFLNKIKELKGILKIPRLYSQYIEKIKQLEKANEFKLDALS